VVAPTRRAGSRVLAHLLTAAYALVVTPIATGLLAYGGSRWVQYVMVNWSTISLGDFLSTPAAAPIVLGLVVGLLLLLSVVATGFASAAGLLAVGAMSLVSIVLAAVPPAALRGVRRPPVDGSRRGRRRLRLRPPAHPPRAHRGPRASP